MHLLPCNLLPIQVFCCVLRIPAILPGAMPAMFQVLLAVLCFSWNVPCRNGSMTLERLYSTFLWWMEDRNQLLGAATQFQEADRKLFRTIPFLKSSFGIIVKGLQWTVMTWTWMTWTTISCVRSNATVVLHPKISVPPYDSIALALHWPTSYSTYAHLCVLKGLRGSAATIGLLVEAIAI